MLPDNDKRKRYRNDTKIERHVVRRNNHFYILPSSFQVVLAEKGEEDGEEEL